MPQTVSPGSDPAARYTPPVPAESEQVAAYLSPEEMRVLARKVFDLLRAELRIERERIA